MAWKRKWKGNAFFLSKIHSKFPHGNWWAIAIRNRIANAHLPKTQFENAHANAPWGWPFPWPGVYLKRSSKTRTRMHHGVGHFLTCRLLKTQFENAHANAPWRWQFPWPVVYRITFRLQSSQFDLSMMRLLTWNLWSILNGQNALILDLISKLKSKRPCCLNLMCIDN